MWFKKCVCALLVLIVITGSCISVSAKSIADENQEEYAVIERASGKFNMNISAKKFRESSTSFPLDVGEIVTIKASYSPFSANVDFGLISPNGRFYYVTTTNGNIDQRIRIPEKGNYIFAIRNNSSYQIHVSGYVTY